jgi:hypothetical protein
MTRPARTGERFIAARRTTASEVPAASRPAGVLRDLPAWVPNPKSSGRRWGPNRHGRHPAARPRPAGPSRLLPPVSRQIAARHPCRHHRRSRTEIPSGIRRWPTSWTWTGRRLWSSGHASRPLSTGTDCTLSSTGYRRRYDDRPRFPRVRGAEGETPRPGDHPQIMPPPCPHSGGGVPGRCAGADTPWRAATDHLLEAPTLRALCDRTTQQRISRTIPVNMEMSTGR